MKRFGVLALVLFVGNTFSLPDCEDINTLDNCFGSITFKTGEKYIGDFKNDMRHGIGKITFPNGTSYVGEWKEDLQEGTGIMDYASGASYEGEWRGGVLEGIGKFTWPNGDTYTGEFEKNEIKNGKGIFNFFDGTEYIGDIFNGKPSGHGEILFTEGDRYVGQVEKLVPQGKGRFIFPDGLEFEGLFKDGLIQKEEGKWKYPISNEQKLTEEVRKGFWMSFIDGFFDGASEGLSASTRSLIFENAGLSWQKRDRNSSRQIECLTEKVNRLDRNNGRKTCENGKCFYEVPMFSGIFDRGSASCLN